MKIEHTIRRAAGTEVPMGELKYHFKPASDAPDAPHVAEVTDEAHIGRLLSIEGFRIAPGSTKAAVAPAPAASTKAPAPAPKSDPLVLKRGDETIDLRELSKSKLLAFAEANDIPLTNAQKRLSVDDVRAAIAAAATV